MTLDQKRHRREQKRRKTLKARIKATGTKLKLPVVEMRRFTHRNVIRAYGYRLYMKSVIIATWNWLRSKMRQSR